MPIQSGLITVMERAARKAAVRLRRDFGEVEQLQVSRKGPADFVSNADRAAERTLVQELTRARPGWGFRLEEGADTPGELEGFRWIIDPLDGTTNFLHGVPHFAISIAAEQAGHVVAGLIHQPVTDETFWAEKGRGAWLSDRRLRVSARTELADCLFATGIPFKAHGDHAQFRAILAAVSPEVAGVRRFGSAALDLAWVAAGRFDGYWESPFNDYDVAAGMLLVREAGGFVTDYRGGERVIERAEIVAGSDRAHSMLHRLVAGAVR